MGVCLPKVNFFKKPKHFWTVQLVLQKQWSLVGKMKVFMYRVVPSGLLLCYYFIRYNILYIFAWVHVCWDAQKKFNQQSRLTSTYYWFILVNNSSLIFSHEINSTTNFKPTKKKLYATDHVSAAWWKTTNLNKLVRYHFYYKSYLLVCWMLE